ncbi:uncharacterized protein L969DRAFT_93181 [Mixia osmundae IAM 14324]|uniref:uncharacterized protein n=1 Tax=Mixia osmundae (strain CBS 9802 / IAM 14324 / JCM 22182 / KY 12970) TaxID=764103 RepID=UPI0004A54911|nr:uncharacterized protein L969DRAFT_93181 [Mixia osmundae IAM 14324]KEI40637.1 hypothetical protein L969DRAFT_93181 [Mixia osmundae IAM 14324]
MIFWVSLLDSNGDINDRNPDGCCTATAQGVLEIYNNGGTPAARLIGDISVWQTRRINPRRVETEEEKAHRYPQRRTEDANSKTHNLASGAAIRQPYEASQAPSSHYYAPPGSRATPAKPIIPVNSSIRPNAQEQPPTTGFGGIHQSEQHATDGEQRYVRASSDPVSRPGLGHYSSKLDLEPNPFEQSFSSSHPPPPGYNPALAANKLDSPSLPRRARSSSPAIRTPSAHPFASGTGATPSHQTPITRDIHSSAGQANIPVIGSSGGSSAVKLPPLASLASPTPANSTSLHNFGWDFDHSLRSGPLSPAMLAGPAQNHQQPHQHHPHINGASGSHSLFDSSSLRTGLTPMIEGGDFPPPSPATQAMFAMMTNQTPGTGGNHAGAGADSSARNDPNHFEASFSKANETASLRVRAQSNPGIPTGEEVAKAAAAAAAQTQGVPRPLTSGQRAAIAVGAAARGRQGPIPTGYHGQPVAPSIAPSSLNNAQQQQQQQHQQQQQQQAAMQHNAYATNPLYLLTQASQGLEQGGEPEDLVAAAALSNLNSAGSYGNLKHLPYASNPYHQHSQPNQQLPSATISQNGSSNSPASQAPARQSKRAPKKRKQEEDVPVPAPSTKKTGRAKKPKDEPEDIDFNDGSSSLNGGAGDDGRSDNGDWDANQPPRDPSKPETEEEKRKSFLERNRQAALKCRQRKKAWLSQLQAKVEYLTSDNETLQNTVNSLRDEISSLRNLLVTHKDCSIGANGHRTLGEALGHQQPNHSPF